MKSASASREAISPAVDVNQAIGGNAVFNYVPSRSIRVKKQEKWINFEIVRPMRQHQSQMTAGHGAHPRPGDEGSLSPQQLVVFLKYVIVTQLAGAVVAVITLRVASPDQTVRLAG